MIQISDWEGSRVASSVLGYDIEVPSDWTKVDQYDELLSDIMQFENDPLAFTLYAFPWGEPGTALEKFSGPEAWQVEILELIRDGIIDISEAIVRISIRSGHGIGKSAMVSILILWAMLKEDTRGVVTANSERQLRTKTWAELGKWYDMYIAKDLFKLTATSLFPCDRSKIFTWRIDMVPWSEHNTTAFQGLHNQGKRILIVFDEASEIPKVIWTTAQGALSDANTQIIWFAAGNPTEPAGEFYNIHQPSDHNPWITRAIDSRTVSFTNKKELERQIAADPEGLESDIIKVRILGEFPKTGFTTFISRAVVLEAMSREEVHVPDDEPWVIGVDVARYGHNWSVLYPRRGRDARSKPRVRLKGQNTMAIVAAILQLMRELRTALVAVDEGGVGGGVVDRLRELNITVIAVNFGSSATPHLSAGNRTKSKYFNKRAEIYGMMKDWLPGAILPNEQPLADSICAPLQKIQGDDIIQLERKDVCIDRLKKLGMEVDLDDADALAISMAVDTSFFLPDTVDAGFSGTGSVEGLDHNPYEGIRTYM